MLRNRLFLTAVTTAALAIIGLWVWIWSPEVAGGLAATLACGLLLYLYLVRLVPALAYTGRWRYSLRDILGLALVTALLASIGRSSDGIVALALWPWTVAAFRWRTRDANSRSEIRQTLFWTHATYLGLAMIISALFTHWLTTRWPYYLDRQVEPPVLVFLFWPALLTMMTIQQDMEAEFMHPSLVVAIGVAIATVVLVSIITSAITSVLMPRARPPR